ncbi:hypothetical protein MA20_46905 [Bradyrhizobium japonicum]|uniref:Uncharacterized protein n=2 Tax=Nitrobacteraceae TaxID=41294 RepID=A0A0A3XIG0_BRAJP|nr:hypothetical protein MA20_46905 [Bradyrhizobium japonicum]
MPRFCGARGAGTRAISLRRNSFTVLSNQYLCLLGVRAWGDITMTDSERKERVDRLERYRVLEDETTDPLAAGLLHDIVEELEAELEAIAAMAASMLGR